MAATAQPAERCSASEHCTPRVTPDSALVRSCNDRTNAPNSSGSITPAVSHTVTVAAPAATAVCSASDKNAGSARVASPALKATSVPSDAAFFTSRSMSSSMAAGFLWHWYSICTVESGAWMQMQGCFASRSTCAPASTSASVSGTDSTSFAFRTVDAMDLTSSASATPLFMGGSSMAWG